jgi:hypothetical protein
MLSDCLRLPEVFVHDHQAGLATRVSMDSVGNEGNDYSCRAGGRFSPGRQGVNISADGRFVAFYSDALNLVRGDINKAPDVFLIGSWVWNGRPSGARYRLFVEPMS